MGNCYTHTSHHPTDECLKCVYKTWWPAGCCINGVLYDLHERNPDNPCVWCNHFKNLEGWTLVPEGYPCGAQSQCDGEGSCN